MIRRLAGCLLLGFALVACSEPPDKEHHQAVGAVEAARAAGAETYAPAEFTDAQSALAKYDESVAQHDYRQALNNALEARNLAYDAAKQAGNKKAELRSEADRLAAHLEALVAAADARLSAAAGRPTGAAAARLRANRDAGRTAMQKARTRSEQQDYPGAIALLTPAVEKLSREPAASEPPVVRKKK
jgi:hypothetical protein